MKIKFKDGEENIPIIENAAQLETHTRDVEGRDDLHAPRLAFHANQILDVLFEIAEAVGERLCSRRSLLLALRLLCPEGIQRLATVLTEPSVLRLEDDRRLQDLYRVPRPLRHHTTVATSGGVKQDAVRLVALIVIDHLHQLPTQEENVLRALRMTVDRHDRPWQQRIEHTLRMIPLRRTQVIILAQARIHLSLFKKPINQLFIYFHNPI